MSAAQEIKYKLKNSVAIACFINVTNDTKLYHTIIS